jgi:hypothetical protein
MIMVSLGLHTAFFFMRFRSLASSYLVSSSQGACFLSPGTTSGGGGVHSRSALLVDIPATALCTFVPIEPGGRGVLIDFGNLILDELLGLLTNLILPTPPVLGGVIGSSSTESQPSVSVSTVS